MRRALLVMVLLAGVASGQLDYFGKNKVQTRDYGFQRMETEHFRIFFYPGGEAIAEFAARSAELYYRQTARDLAMELPDKTPLILYLSPGQFSETNVVLDIIEEGVGGFSELIRNRIVVPFDGSYNNLHHVIGHELVHIFEFQMFYRSHLSALLGAVSEFQIPLWVVEGFAEFQSDWVNVSSDVFMRDLLMGNRFVPLARLHDGMGYLVYREGESFYRFVADRYGRKKVYEFLHSLAGKRSLDGAFSATFGKPIDRVSEDWEKWLRMRYWPEVRRLSNFDTLAEKLTDHRRDGSVYNTAPALSPSGTRIALISDRSEYADLYVLSATDGRVLRRLVSGGRSGGFENMHLLRPGLSWSPDEKLIAVVTASAGRDNVALVDAETGRVKKRLASGLDAVYSPTFAPDGTKLAFVGLRNGFSDIYTVGTGGGEPLRTTYDMYDDRDPAYSPGGETLAFVSDRPDPDSAWLPGRYAVWLTVGSGQPVRVTPRAEQVSHPQFTHAGDKLVYACADSASNLYLLDLASGRVVGRTRFLGDASYPTLSRDDRKLAFAYYNDVGWDVAMLHEPLERLGRDTTPAFRAALDTLSFDKSGIDFSRVRPAGFDLAVDYATGAASYSSGSLGGVSGTVNVAFSDLLGNHRFEVYTDIYGDILNSDFVFQYWLLPHRIDYGFAFMQFRDYPFVSNTRVVERMNRGLTVLIGYPFDRFTRLELGMTGVLAQSDSFQPNPATLDPNDWRFFARVNEHRFHASPAFVFDNTYWTYQGPARGTRVRVGGDVSFLSSYQFADVNVDLRNYQRLWKDYVWASRLAAIQGFGPGAGSHSIGAENVRGYDWAEFADSAGSGLAIASFEFRYPFIERLKLGFPLPLELGGIRGVAFADAGLVMRDSMQVWDRANSRLADLKVGVGVGLRIQVSYFALKFDFAKPLSYTDDKSWKFHFGLGTDF